MAEILGTRHGPDRPSRLQSRPVTSPLPDLVLYGRPGCHLCEDARAVLDALLTERAAGGLPVPRLRELSIDDDPVLQDRYRFTIPVVALGGRELELATSPTRLSQLLADVLDGDAPGDGR
jgi:hypothetical protein